MNNHDEKELVSKLNALYEEMLLKNSRYVGFPNSRINDHRDLARFLQFPINNIGDPFYPNAGINTCLIEQELLDFFRKLLNLEASDYWGYVTNGGTEGNICGLYQGREIYPDGMLYYSEDSHYSLYKIARFLRIDTKIIPSLSNGEMDYAALSTVSGEHDDRPAIINANIGTTMKGAIDRVEKIIVALQSAGIKNYYIHCDAALFGCMLPFMADAPVFDFRLPIGSMAISGHKFLGSPIPCGILMTRKTIKPNFEGGARYVGSIDTTVSGSRDGFSVLILWSTIKRFGMDGLARLVQESRDLTKYALSAINQAGWDAWVNPFSTTIVIKNPGEELVEKWQLAFTKELAHLIILPGVTKTMIDGFVADLQEMIKTGLHIP
ncbi:MAG: histidine decarboxylase [Desulfatirhabdiaceae bacterium]